MISSLIALLIKVAIVLVVVVVIKSLKSSSSDNSLNKNTSTISDRVKSYAQENQEYYESIINSSSFNFNDRFNICPDKSDLGDYGEFLTFKEIVKWSSCHSYNYKILRNLNIGTHCEIDLVWIHETGIYVFESKNISGQIYGDENSNQWCIILNNRTKKQFYNPIFQNNGHINALKRILGNHNSYCSIIVFSERCELKDIPPNTQSRIITKRNYLQSKLTERIAREQSRLSIAQIEALYRKLLPYAYASQDIKQKHSDYINKKYGYKNGNDDDVNLPF
ncbi:nuclease-related domain-containing protein [Fibrobacter sp. UWB12]|uniref:nuclease-related domain-containing protein n=1 Tax=Fibrobacter sp. UWB12 TaxID=1896203 RepID=UPI00091A6C4C|nr:nuclease-related domain-containing protein [Fibrobacter sp. UWB12]SHK98030.1 Nuclease-related domain-containing protein [Fibrobacter sp. UWB12]